MRDARFGSRWLLVFGGVLCACAGGAGMERPATPSFAVSPVQVEVFSPAERRVLESGRAVHRERELTRRDQRYLGTVSYQLVKARPSTILAAFSEPSNLSELLPNTKRATLIEVKGQVQRVELVQGNEWVDADYTVYLEHASEQGVRFWLDRSRSHDIDDAFGYFRAEPFGHEQTLMTVAVAVDIGSGLLRGLFSGAVQSCILTTPDLIKRYTERLEAEHVALRVPQHVFARAVPAGFERVGSGMPH